MATRSDPRRKSPARKVNRTATATRRARLVTAVAALSRKVYGTATATRHARVVTAVAALTVVVQAVVCSGSSADTAVVTFLNTSQSTMSATPGTLTFKYLLITP